MEELKFFFSSGNRTYIVKFEMKMWVIIPIECNTPNATVCTFDGISFIRGSGHAIPMKKRTSLLLPVCRSFIRGRV